MAAQPKTPPRDDQANTPPGDDQANQKMLIGKGMMKGIALARSLAALQNANGKGTQAGMGIGMGISMGSGMGGDMMGDGMGSSMDGGKVGRKVGGKAGGMGSSMMGNSGTGMGGRMFESNSPDRAGTGSASMRGGMVGGMGSGGMGRAGTGMGGRMFQSNGMGRAGRGGMVGGMGSAGMGGGMVGGMGSAGSMGSGMESGSESGGVVAMAAEDVPDWPPPLGKASSSPDGLWWPCHFWGQSSQCEGWTTHMYRRSGGKARYTCEPCMHYQLAQAKASKHANDAILATGMGSGGGMGGGGMGGGGMGHFWASGGIDDQAMAAALGATQWY